MENKNILTHETIEYNFEEVVENYRKKIVKRGEKEGASVEELLNILNEMTQFEFGRNLLINRGANGYMTRYISLYQKRKHEYDIKNPLEKLILESPLTIAYQQRFDVCQNLLKKLMIKDEMTVCSLPCGLMDDLLTLNLPKEKNYKFVGIDIDQDSTNGAFENAKELNLDHKCKFYTMDAWKIEFENEFDILTSNGLIQYVKDQNDVIKFYRLVYNSLKIPGFFIISSYKAPNTFDNSFKSLNALQVFSKEILDARFSNFPSEEEIIKDLKFIGFDEFQVFYDEMKMCPTILAIKHKK
jgi:ubiquinone/menaquinone biosynthesis C-methylase UbiE